MPEQTITINGYWDGRAQREKRSAPDARQPLVHIMAWEDGELQSISFTPDEAVKVATAIMQAVAHTKQASEPAEDFWSEVIRAGA